MIQKIHRARGTQYNIIIDPAGMFFWERVVCRCRPNKFMVFENELPKYGTVQKLTCYRS